jgi:choline dehydrogenase-like flavoprotein
LDAAGVTQRVDLPSVGENLQDHVRITASWQLKDGYITPDELRTNATFAAEQLARWQNNQTGFYDETSSGYAYMQWAQAGYSQSDFVKAAEQSADKSNPVDALKLNHLKNTGLRVPQLEILFQDGYLGNKGYPAVGSPLYGEHFAGFIASINHAYARGNTHINSSDIADKPQFNPRYLSNPFDVKAVASAAKYLRKIANTAPFSSAIVSEYEPGTDVVQTDADWVTYARNNVATIWHPLGTCAMLPKNKGGVVDKYLRVYGTTNLRVVDASIMPILISGHIQTAVYGIAERAAVMIAEKWS